jgi:hypothetical protein
MKIGKPTPSMAVSVAALAMATTGTAAAAVNYARHAGTVDGISAVLSRSSKHHAAGRLVATARSGAHKGQIPAKFLANVPVSTTFSRTSEVVDNAAGAPAELNRTGFGTLTASCNDQADAPGVEDATTTISFNNGFGQPLNLARTQGRGNAQVVSLPPGTAHTFTINGSNTFRVQVEFGGVDVSYEGQVRQDGSGTPAATCYVAGTVETVTP